MTVRQFLRSHTSRQISELMAYDRLEPFGDGRLNLGIATLSAITANINRDTKRQAEPFKPEQLVPFYWPYEAPAEDKRRTVARKLKAHLKSRKR